MTDKTVSFSKNSINVFFHILTKCNLKCRHCYINPAQHGRETLPLKTIESWLDAFSVEKKEANVIFLGGEPTLHPDLSAAAAYAKKSGFHSVTIDTNGYLFHDILNETSPEIIDYISFSLDGATRQTNDAIRGTGSYDKCVGGIKDAILKGFKTSLIYTVSSANLDELEKIPELAASLGLNKVFIQVLGIRGNSAVAKGTGQTITQVSKKQWQQVVPEVSRKISRMGIETVYPKVFLEKSELFECAGLVANNYFIFPNGRVYRCPLCEDFPLHSLCFEKEKLVETPRINEADFFDLSIPEGCVINKVIQPGNLSYTPAGEPEYKIACCMLKEKL